MTINATKRILLILFLSFSGCMLDYSMEDAANWTEDSDKSSETDICSYECMSETVCTTAFEGTVDHSLTCTDKTDVCCLPPGGTDLDTDMDTDTDADSDTDTDSDTDADLDTDTDTDSDTDTDTDTEPPANCNVGQCTEPEWVFLKGGVFQMGSTLSGKEQPVHQVTLQGFEMSRTEVTVAEYLRCVAAGECTNPDTWSTDCYWNRAGYDDYPVNCVNWDQASAYCRFAGGRLPSEAEWEYAARSQGKRVNYPWGDETPTCNLAISNSGCGTNLPWPVCSKKAGNSAQGLCDLAGNVYEWIQDSWHSNYNGAPADGSAWEGGGTRIVRGGAYNCNQNQARASYRGVYFGTNYVNLFIGIRCARSLP